MVLLTINIPENIREKLRLEKNQSELVTNLLVEFYKQKDFNSNIDQELQKFKDNAEKIINGLNEKENDLIQKKELIDKTNKEEKIMENKRKEKEKIFIETIIRNAKELFKADITQVDVNDYLTGNYEDFLSYLISKGLVKEKEY
jgi:membrane-associated HD superfamily phosphohydrolase